MIHKGLGVAELTPLPELVADSAGWEHLRARMESTIFLRSEGMSVELGMPQELSESLAAQARRLVRSHARFSDVIAADYFSGRAGRDPYLVNEILAPLIEADRSSPWSSAVNRIDCVLRADGTLIAIENNSVAVCLFHFRGLLYLIRGLWRAGHAQAARRLDGMVAAVAAGFRRYYEARAASVVDRPTIGAVVPHGWLRAAQRLYRAGFERHGWRYVLGTPNTLEVRADGVYVSGERVDLLWADFLFYMAYQAARYTPSEFPSNVGRFDPIIEEAERFVGDERFLDHVRAGRVVNLSPATAYLTLPKPLFSRVHYDSPDLGGGELEWLREHVARSYAVRQRAEGVVSRDEAATRKDELVLKPALYGGSRGVMVGRSCERDEWERKLDEVWEDPSWVLQEFIEPVKTSQGEYLTIGLCGAGGEFGGALPRSSPSPNVKAREARFIAAVPPSWED